MVANSTTPATTDGHFPLHVYREYEEQLLDLCASGSLDTSRWAQLGSRFFMAGLAVMLASICGADRRGLLALAESLHPGATEPSGLICAARIRRRRRGEAPVLRRWQIGGELLDLYRVQATGDGQRDCSVLRRHLNGSEIVPKEELVGRLSQ